MGAGGMGGQAGISGGMGGGAGLGGGMGIIGGGGAIGGGSFGGGGTFGGGGSFGGGGGGFGGGVGGAGAGFPLGQQFALKFANSRCLYPENDQTSSGTKLVLPTEVCGTDLAKFTISDKGNLKHVKTGFCVQPENGNEGGDDSALVISEKCDKKWAFTMTGAGSLKLAESGKCVQPATGGTRPSQTENMVLRDTCDTPETQFSIWGKIFHAG